jgi:hypothetical protein
MADQQTPPNTDDPPQQTKPDQVTQCQQEQQPQSVLVAQQDGRPVPGRRPHFRRN